MTSAPAIGFEYRPSRWLGRLVLAMAVLAAVALWLCALALALKLAASLLLFVAATRTWRTLARSPLRAAGWSQQGGWSLRMADGEDVAASLRAFRVAGEQAVWLHLSTAGHGRYSLLLAPDNSDADIRRRLRMRLAAAASNDAGPSPGTPAAERGPTV